MAVIDEIFEIFAGHGNEAYFGENVSQTEHALQSAHLAEQANAKPELVVAALLHDIGHMLAGLAEDAADHGQDDAHESAGATWLAEYFSDDVTSAVRLHVAAKRYLCTVDPDYRKGLSEASQKSLELQGGSMNAAETRQFERERHFEAAVSLRRWDDQAKVPGLTVPDLEHYRGVLTLALQRGRTNA